MCYKTARWWYEIGKRILTVPFLSLVNLIAGRAVVTELIHDCTPNRIAEELKVILPGGPKRDEQMKGYAEVRHKLGAPGASERAGKLMVEELRNSSGTVA
ncbi:MAG: lipid-A-disaccharide synthase [Spirosoma sp.]|nr:lipid-A-disaccharide synthase [Spirosoma sp.]